MDLFAAIDVGSNSIRLQIAAFVSGFQHHIVREYRAVTRLGESVFQTGTLSDRAIQDSLQVLKDYRTKAEEHAVVDVRAVGTSALREAHNGNKFLKTVKRECGFEVEIVSGREEARLIHLGVMSRVPNPDEPSLLIDIGGGSAEFTLSRDRRMVACTSAQLGAVRLTEMFLESEPPEAAEIERLEGFIRQKLQRVKKALDAALLAKAVKSVIGTSGTMAALARAVNRIEATRAEITGQVFSAADLESLYRRLRHMKLGARREVVGLNARRAEIIVAGAATVAVAMRELGIEEIAYHDAGLRDGVLIEMAARRKRDEAGLQYLKKERLETIRNLGERYGYAPPHSEHVALLARQLFQLLQPLHEMPDEYGELLEAAAMLHDVGHYVNSAKHHKHSYYLIAHSDLPGYSDRERMLIATIARYHRGAWPERDHEGYSDLTPKEQRAVEQLAALLRIADSCDNGRRRLVQSLVATPKSDRVELTLLATGPVELEAWTAEKAAGLFRKAFDRKLQVHVQLMKPVG